MISPEIENILIKFFNKSATQAELEILDKWINTSNNQSTFNDYIKANYAITLGLNDPDASKIKEFLLTEIRKEKNPFNKKSLKIVFKYAAMLVFFLGTGYLVNQNILKGNNEESLIPNNETITLQLENGDTQTISENGTARITDSSGNMIMQQQGSQLVYNKKASLEKLKYNTLTVPFGRRFDIILSDGTHVFLNSGSSIKYPVQFIRGNPRHVFLKGEAFFDVTKDTTHPFLVSAQTLEVNVLGTKFNVTTYPEDDNTEVVLVEGSVSLNSSENKSEERKNVILKPGFKGTFNNSEQTISIKNVNTTMYTSWIDGTIIFRNAPFSKIIKKLERHYNITIINHNQDLAQENFNASFEVDHETINEVLHYFNKVYQIEYEIKNNKVIIK